MRILTDIGVTDIQNREVSFQNGLLRAKAIFQRHNYQLYQVFCPHFNNPLGVDPSINLTLRVIRCLNDEESIQILRDMQNKVINHTPSIYLTKFYVMAMIQ
jgi:hypothetical protein